MLVKTNTMNIIEKLQIAVQAVKMTTEEIGGSIEVRLDGLTKNEIYEAANKYDAGVVAPISETDYYFSYVKIGNSKIILTTKTK